MTLPDPTAAYFRAPLAELLAILLRQYRRPLRSREIELTDADGVTLAEMIVARAPLTDQARAVRDALAALIAESEAVLARWDLTLAQALDTPMDQIPGWETTADFLEIANEKANAELRISTGAALLTALGQTRYATYLVDVVARGVDDLDAVIAQRVLTFVSGLPADEADWLSKIRVWAAAQ
ncbi:MAG: hypothetical protein GYB67_13270 [Chloroflexi bacterium]|nr:hypothetical protein [Chloroflexota bacterium]